MRANYIYATSLAAAMVAGVFVLAEAGAEGNGVPHGEASGNTANEMPVTAQLFSGFDFDRLWAVPGEAGEGKTGENLGLEGRNPAGPAGTFKRPGPAPEAAPKSGIAESPRIKQTLAPKPAPEAMRKQLLDGLFDRLRKAGDQRDAQRIAASIERVWLNSYSDTANLLMQRAMDSMQAGDYPLALSLLDKLVAFEPGWAEAWNQRATTRLLTGDTDGAMADIGEAVNLEPRHFDALAGMGMIMQGEGLEKSALKIFKEVLGIYPLEPNIQKLDEKLTLEIEGQDI
ncbi:MAG: tetratricopeptide repeat protein [Beijerinckiaceae bacterium]